MCFSCAISKLLTIRLEFRESYVSPGKTETKQGKLSNLYPWERVILKTYKSQNVNPISPAPKFTLGIIHIKVKSL